MVVSQFFPNCDKLICVCWVTIHKNQTNMYQSLWIPQFKCYFLANSFLQGYDIPFTKLDQKTAHKDKALFLFKQKQKIN